MDIYSSKFAIIVIIALVGVLALQVMTNSSNTAQQIDSETCELYVMDSQINAKKYLNEFDQKCLDFKNLNP
jgi:type II secretory pathway pseudopilin PulG